jgi:hypothetical protein
LSEVILPDPDTCLVDLWREENDQQENGAFDEKYRNVKVLFFDIDETMVHCIDDRDPSSMVG